MEIIADVRGRVDKLLADALPQYSRSALYKLFGLDMIKLNGETVRPGHKVKEGSVISADLSPLEQEPEVIELPILYEDDNVIAVNKPAGIISHARGKYWYEPSVASFIRWHTLKGTRHDLSLSQAEKDKALDLLNNSDMLKPSIERTGIVHRLDRATSGVMVCTKNENTMRFLQKQFADRTVEKTYIAVVSGKLDQDEAIIDAPIERNPLKPVTFRVGEGGKAAQTHYKVLSYDETTNRSVLELKPKTGRTHQLRVHLSYIKHPILGDPLYGDTDERLLLHAWKLSIDLPDTGNKVFESPIPQEFGYAVK
jgi:23S rRNA pseudouridine1911/1915/1917 synthase